MGEEGLETRLSLIFNDVIIVVKLTITKKISHTSSSLLEGGGGGGGGQHLEQFHSSHHAEDDQEGENWLLECGLRTWSAHHTIVNILNVSEVSREKS